ncbi:MAG: YceI family protein, partial [Thermoanaerobaculia bacterium]
MRLLLALLLASLAPSAVPRQEAPARPSRYRLEVAGSSLRWELPATLHIVRGIAPVFHGSIETDAAVPGGWLGRIVVPAASMVTGNRRRDRTMRDKILETDRYPEIVFELKSLPGDVSQLRPGDS